MKKQLIAILLSSAFAAPAVAGDNANLNISASVNGTCKFTTATFNMNFGALDPAAAVLQNQSTALTYKCTKNQAATSFSFDTVTVSPTSVNLSNGIDNIPVSLSWTVPATQGSGFGGAVVPISMTVSGQILAADYANVSAGAYTKTVAVVVAP